MPRRAYSPSDYDDRYERDYVSRSNGRERERVFREEEDLEYSRRPPPPPPAPEARVRETDVRVREREADRGPPEFLREDYGRTTSGPVVLRAREREDFEFAPRSRPRSPERPPPPREIEKEEIVIRGLDRDRPPPRREYDEDTISIRGSDRRRPEREYDREELIIRNDDRSRAPPARDYERDELISRRDRDDRSRGAPLREFERDEFVVRRDERERGPPSRADYERDEVIIRRDERDRGPPPPRDYERDEVIIRRDERDRGPPRRDFVEHEELVLKRDDRDRGPPPREAERDEIIIRRGEREREREPRYERDRDDLYVSRTMSHERERSRGRDDSQEIIIRRNERSSSRGRRDKKEEEIIIRRNDPSPSPEPLPPPPEPPIIRAPPIHQEVITHHRHIDHGYELALAPISRARTPEPPPPPPPPPPPQEDERIEIRRRGERDGRAWDDEIIIDREASRRLGPERAPAVPSPPQSVYSARGYEREDELAYRPRRPYEPRDERDLREEAEYYNRRAVERSYVGEGYNGATHDWEIVDVPPGTRRVRMDGAGGGAQEVTWQRYNGVRRSKFIAEGDEYGSEYGGALVPAAPGGIGRSYQGIKDKTDGLWTEITKDLVVKEAIQESGYDYEETEDFFYVIAYLKYDDVERLVKLSDDIRSGRRNRIRQIEWERKALPPPEPRPPWNEEVIREREVVYDRRPPRGYLR